MADRPTTAAAGAAPAAAQVRLPIVPRKEAYVTDIALESQGFPAEISKAFLHTADETNCVVACRAPGGPTTQLIREGHDLKGYLVKAKSCSWGPMAGFLCQLPPFNKAGAAKIVYNAQNHKRYLEYRIKHGLRAQPAFVPLLISDARKQQVLTTETLPADGSQEFPQPLLFREIDADHVAGVAYPVSNDDKKADRSVVMEFLLVRRPDAAGGPPLWALYHGRIWYRVEENGPYRSLYSPGPDLDKDGVDRTQIWSIDPGKPEPVAGSALQTIEAQASLGGAWAAIAIPAAAAAAYERSLASLLGKPDGPRLDKLYPICGAQNPYPPYTPRDKRAGEPVGDYDRYVEGERGKLPQHRNAVTGDFDLFAIWPVRPKIDWPMMVRPAEQRLSTVSPTVWKGRPGTTASGSTGLGFFVPSAAKPSSLVLRASPNTFVEVIAGFTEIKPFESDETGNNTELTSYVAQELNSLVSIAAGKRSGASAGRMSPNMAFHNDEGGRPGIDEVDYAFAVYLPNALFESISRDHKRRYTKQQSGQLNPKSRMLLIDRHDDFIDLACMLSDHCYVTMNHIWLMQMFTLLADKLDRSTDAIVVSGDETDNQEKVRKKRKEFFEKRVTERDKAKKSNGSDPKILNLERLKAGLMHLFVGHLAPGTIGSSEQRANGQEALLRLADAFLQIAAKDFESDLGTVERMIGRLNAAMLVPASTAAPSR